MRADRGSKDDGIDVAGISTAAGAIALAVALSLLIAWRLIEGFGGSLHGPVVRPAPMPQPRLEVHPLLDRRVYEIMEWRKISAYGWVDRDKGIVRIPIDDAMNLLSQRAASHASDQGGAAP